MRGGVRQQRHMAGVFQCDAQAALMLGAGARLAARLDLPTLRKIPFEPPNILIVNLTNVINTKSTDFAPRAEVTSSAAKASAPSGSLSAIKAFAAIRPFTPFPPIRPFPSLTTIEPVS